MGCSLRVRPAFLEVFASLFPALAHGDLLTHRVLLYVRISSSRVFRTKIGSFFDIVPMLSLSNRIQLLPGKMWAVREEAYSFATFVSCVIKRVENIMPALQAYHAQGERAAMHRQ